MSMIFILKKNNEKNSKYKYTKNKSKDIKNIKYM